MIETEHHWLNYEFEEAQVKVDLSDMILEHLVEELVTFMDKKYPNNENEKVEEDEQNAESDELLFWTIYDSGKY